MKVLMIDRDRLTAQMLTSQLEEQGHSVEIEPVKNTALERLRDEKFDAVFFDPSPQSDSRPFVLGLRRALKQGDYPYILLCSHQADAETCSKSGANDFLTKPLDTKLLRHRIDNIARYSELTRYLANLEVDYPSRDGIIAKSAIHQLFLACVDRADRYGEKTFLLFFTLENYDEIVAEEGEENAKSTFDTLAKYIKRLRRQSDILGQTNQNEFCLMLMRPVYESEPVDAADRYIDTLQSVQDIATPNGGAANIRLSLIGLPSAETIVDQRFTPGSD